jgi:hypothetical protein
MRRSTMILARLAVAALALAGLATLAAPAADAARVVSVKPADREGEYRVEASGFLAGEQVGVRLIGPDERVIKLGREEASQRGRVRVTVFIRRYEPGGTWTVRFRGVDSDKTAREAFDVPPRGPNADLVATPAEAVSGVAVALAGAGFDPGERVGAWLTRPDGGGVDLGEARADEAGGVAYA